MSLERLEADRRSSERRKGEHRREYDRRWHERRVNSANLFQIDHRARLFTRWWPVFVLIHGLIVWNWQPVAFGNSMDSVFKWMAFLVASCAACSLIWWRQHWPRYLMGAFAVSRSLAAITQTIYERPPLWVNRTMILTGSLSLTLLWFCLVAVSIPYLETMSNESKR